jgi:polyisoprenoid-binding protein YceI
MDLRLRFASLGLLASALAVSGAQAAPAWTVDKAHSRLGFDSAFSGTKFSGGFGQWDAAIAFDPKDLASSKATVTINLASAKTGDNDRDSNLPTSDWFDTAKFAKAVFTTTSIRSLGGNKYLASGVLNLKGVSKPVNLPFTLVINGKAATMNGSVAIDRSLWGVGAGQFAGEDTVPHAVTVQIAINAVRN